MDKECIVDTLASIDYFSRLDRCALELIRLATQHSSYEQGECVFHEGDACIGLYIVINGWARAVKTSPAGREQVIRFVGPGDVFNEVGVLTGGVNVVTVETLEPLELLIVQREILLGLVDEHPSLAKRLIENLANRILYAMDMVVDLSLHTVESRLARFLLQQADEERINRHKWATQAVIAARIGTVPVVLNRALRIFVEKRLIDLSPEEIIILNRKELERIALLNP
ncbi:MAG: Crp/Fnr family transcriptional regulator [Anaerolineales bacterium]